MKLSDFSLLKEDQESYTIGHPKGKSMIVPKSGMSDKAQKLVSQLKREQHFDEGTPEGTEVEEVDGGGDEANSTDLSTDKPLAVEPVSESVPIASSPEALQADTNVPQPMVNPELLPQSQAQVPPPAAQTAPTPPLLSSTFSDQPYKQAQSDVEAAVKAQDVAGKAEAQSQADAVKGAQAAQQAIDAKAKTYDAQALDLSNKISSGKIDPHRYWNSLSTGSKVTTALGLVLSGIGSGLTHTPNLAMEVMNRAIENDIDAQKNDQSKNMNLWKMNREALGNDRAATLATQSQLYAIAHAQAVKAQASAQGDIAKGRMAPVILGFQQQAQQTNRQRAMLDFAHQGGASGAPNPVDPAQLVSTLVPEKHQQKVFDEIQAAQDTRRMSSSIMGSFEKAVGENTAFYTGAGLLRTPASVYALHQSMQPTFKDLEGTVRQAAMDNTFKNITPRPGDMESTIAEKRRALQDYLKSKASAPTAKGFGIDLNKFQSTNVNTTAYQPGAVVSIE